MKIGFLAIIFLWMATSASAEPVDQCIGYGEQINQQLSDWSYQQFEEKGWRTLASKKCFFAAGRSIVAWLSAHQEDVTAAQARTLRYQAARVFTMSGRNQIALIHLKHARDPDQAANAAQDWNSYIDVFTAWLLRDVVGLRASIERLELQPIAKDGFKPNLIAAKRFLICYALPYNAIETDPACIEKPDEAKEENSAL